MSSSQSGFIGFGYQPRCPNCGGANVVEFDRADGKTLLCATCKAEHERDASGRLRGA